MLAMVLEHPLFGRDDALDELRSAVQRAASGSGAYVLVTGEPGIGKTRLVEAAAEGRPTVWARASEVGAPAGLWLWNQVLRSARRAGRDVDAIGGAAGSATPFAVGESGQGRFLHLDRALAQLHRLADSGFCIIALDDLQWADADSLAVLEMLAPELRDLPLAVLATVHADAVRAVPRSDTTVALTGLGREAVGSIIASVAGAAPSPAVIEAARDLTAGNPLFVTEVARLLQSTSSVLDGSAWHDVLPDGVRAVLTRRLARLPDDALDAVTAAAVVGMDVDATLLAAVIEIDRAEVYDRLQPAVDAGLLADTGDGRFRFGHALIRDAALAEVALRRRRHLHDRTATTLASFEGDRAAGAIASHLRAAGERSRAAGWARIAGARALSAGMPGEAATWFAQAREMGEADPELALHHAEALSRSGATDDARAMFVDVAADARARDDAELFGRAALGVGTIGGGFEVRLLDASQIALLQEALDRVGDEPSPVRVRLLARLSVAGTITLDQPRRAALAHAAVDEARGLDDDRSLVAALAAWCDAHPGPDAIDERLARAEEMVGAATRTGDPDLELLARRYRIVALMETGNVALATAEVRAFAQLADALRQPGFRWYARVAEGMLAFLHGDLDGAWELAEQALVDGRAAGSANAEMLAQGSLQAMILRERGDYDGFVATMSAANADHHEANRGMDFLAPMFFAGYGVEADAVRGVLARVPEDLPWAMEDSLALFVFSSLGDAAAFVGDHQWADRAWAQLVAHPDRFVLDGTAAVCYGPVAATLGRIAAMRGDAAAARDWFDRALAGLAGVNAPLLRRRLEAERAALAPAVDREDAAAAPAARAPARAPTATRARFAREGSTWSVQFGGAAIHLKDAKGLRDLSVLLARPGHEVHVLDLVGAAEGQTASDRSTNADLGAVLDARARHELEERIRDLTEQIEEAEDRNDIGAAANLDEERAQLLAHLGTALGLSGRSRTPGSDAERARKAVSMRIRDTIGRFDRELPALGAHLRNSVRTGVFCSYRPEHPVSWDLD
jgi:tetratricopeptide (TPR) repeat protein